MVRYVIWYNYVSCVHTHTFRYQGHTIISILTTYRRICVVHIWFGTIVCHVYMHIRIRYIKTYVIMYTSYVYVSKIQNWKCMTSISHAFFGIQKIGVLCIIIYWFRTCFRTTASIGLSICLNNPFFRCETQLIPNLYYRDPEDMTNVHRPRTVVGFGVRLQTARRSDLHLAKECELRKGLVVWSELQ